MALVRNFIGVIFAVFLFVYILFNVLTNNFISAEAYRELTRGIEDMEIIAHHERPFRGGILNPESSNMGMEELLSQWGQMRSVRRLMVNSDGIILDENNEIISPNINLMGESVAAEMTFLTNYYFANKDLFVSEMMVRVTEGDNTYYLMATPIPMAGDVYFTALLYTDITSAIAFAGNINQTLAVLLFVSGIIGVLISVFMSSQIQKSIIRLCKYAEIIGQGNFNKKVDNFDYKEFSDLAGSMNNMADMLSDYESNQKQFFQNASHEMRTPLMSIQGYAEGILMDVLDKNEASKIIMSESERMESLVSQLLYVSRMDSGLDALDIADVNVKNFLYDCAWRVKILAEKSGKEMFFSSTKFLKNMFS